MAPIDLASIRESSALTMVAAVVSVQVMVASIVLIVFLCACGKKKEEEPQPTNPPPTRSKRPKPATAPAPEQKQASAPVVEPAEPSMKTAKAAESQKEMSSVIVDVDGAPQYALMSNMGNAESIRPVCALGGNRVNQPSLILMDKDLKPSSPEQKSESSEKESVEQSSTESSTFQSLTINIPQTGKQKPMATSMELERSVTMVV